jgi:hypothetical protein
MTPELRRACERAAHVITPDGLALPAGRAVLCLLALLGWPRVARILAFPPLLHLVEFGYRIVADHRSFFARFFFRRE